MQVGVSKLSFKKSYPLIYGGSQLGALTLSVDSFGNMTDFILNIISVIILQLLILGIVFLQIKSRLDLSLFNPLWELSTYIARDDKEHLKFGKNTSAELVNLLSTYNNMRTELAKSLTLQAEIESVTAVAKIAKQVAHDIRSPLTALDVVMRTEAGMSEEKRILARSAIARINDIANDLLVKNRDKENKMLIDSNVKLNEKRAKSIVLLASLLESLLSEKRLQYRAMLDVDIEYQSTENTYGLFADVDPIEFKRLISNIINNAVEALPNSRGKVELLLSGDQNNISIVIKDNGKGVPSHILPTLGTRGVSYGKDVGTESGTGLGLHHAKSTIESLGGHFEIQSEVGVGTVIKIKLKKVAAPNWFLEKLAIRSDSRIVVVDDDASIHQIWKGRFESLRATKYGVEILNFSSPNDLKNWFEKRPENIETIFLIDYEFLGHTLNGLDIIKALHLEKQAVLVTSRYEEPQIFQLAQQMGVKMIPKGIAGLVPIEFIMPASAVDAVLIDDDELVHMAWCDAAKEANKVIKTFFTYDDFLTEHKQLTQRAPIYIDVSLAGGVRGEEVAKKVFDLGFYNIYLATGFEKTEFNNLFFLKGVIGKDPPWAY
jgi:signal transduction histidine kinase